MYIELTKTVGEIVDDVQPKKEQQNAEKNKETPEARESSSEDVTEEENVVKSIVSAGRQRFGDTKLMAMYSLETPILVEFKK